MASPASEAGQKGPASRLPTTAHVESLDPPHSPLADDAGTTLTLAFHNVNGIAVKDEELVRAADFLQTSIIGICETQLYRARSLCAELGGKTAYRWIFGLDAERLAEGRARGGVAFLVSNTVSRFVSLVKADRNQLWIKVHNREVTLYVCVVYLPPAGSGYAEERQDIVRDLLSNVTRFRARGAAVVIGGDFNARTGVNGDTVVNAEGRELLQLADSNSLEIINFDRRRCSGHFTRERKYGTDMQRSTIDYVMVDSSHSCLVKKLSILDEPKVRLGSDHKPLLVDLNMKRPCPMPILGDNRTFRGLAWNVDRCSPEDWENYRSELQPRLEAWHKNHEVLLASGLDTQSVSDQSTARLELAIKEAAAAAVGARYVYPRKHKPWIDSAILSMIHHRDDLLALSNEEMRANGGTSQEAIRIREEYQRQCRAVRSAIRKKKRKVRSRQYDELQQKSGRQLWQQLRSMFDSRPLTSPEVINRPGGSPAVTHDEKMGEIRAHFERLGTDNAVAGKFDEEFAAQVRLEALAHDEESINLEPHAILDSDIERKEVHRILLNVKSGKAAGPDRIPNELLKHGGSEMVEALLTLFKHIWKFEKWPEQWRQGNVVLLHKKGPPEDLENYRGITLLPTMAKVFESVLNSRLSKWAEENGKLRDEQGGFRPNRRCVDQMFLLHETIASRREAKQPTYCAFIDVRKAYDTVWRDGLWHSLWELEVRGKMHRVLSGMFATMERSVMFEGRCSEPFSVELGVAQGAVTSPFLYACFVDGLLRELAESGLGVSIADVHIACLAYADDIVLIAPSAHKLRLLLSLLTQYAARWRFSFNADKSNVMVFGTKRQIDEAQGELFQLDSEPLSLTADYKYLGCEASAFMGRAGPVIDRLVRAARVKGADLSGPGGCRFNGVHAARSIHLWQVYARPVLEYAAEVWKPTKAQARKLEGVMCDFARHALGVDKRASNDVILSELGLPSLAARRDELRLRYFMHLCNANPDRALSKVFRHRCEEVDRGKAPRSLCRQYRQLLDKYERLDVWQSRPREEEAWKGWPQAARKAVVELDLKERHERMSARPSTEIFLKVKPHDRLMRAAYLYGRGLGVWLKFRLRSNTLPLLANLARYSNPRMTDDCAECLLCDSGKMEDAVHFLLRCPALEDQRSRLSTALHEAMSKHAESVDPITAKLARDTIRAMEGDSDDAKLRLLLGTREEPVKQRCHRSHGKESESPEPTDAGARREGRKERAERRADRSRQPVLFDLDRVVQKYLIDAWQERAQLAGGVPMLDRKGVGLVLGQLQPDGRSRTFAAKADPR
jgi:endonuclease/exonuclease/phosphatase family metal-dependent hydrolase